MLAHGLLALRVKTTQVLGLGLGSSLNYPLVATLAQCPRQSAPSTTLNRQVIAGCYSVAQGAA